MGYFDDKIKNQRGKFFDEELLSINSNINSIDYITDQEKRNALAKKANEEAKLNEAEFSNMEEMACQAILLTPAIKDWFEKVLIPLSVYIDKDSLNPTDDEKIDKIRANAYKALVDRILVKGGHYDRSRNNFS